MQDTQIAGKLIRVLVIETITKNFVKPGNITTKPKEFSKFKN